MYIQIEDVTNAVLGQAITDLRERFQMTLNEWWIDH
jgi:hypothetical protein